MISNRNDKNINSSNLHNSNQIAELVKQFCSEFSENVSTESIRSVTIINLAFSLAPAKLHPVFANNLSRTKFPSIANKIIQKYLNDKKEENLSNFFTLTSSLLWNMTDSSDLFCRSMLACESFKENVAKMLLTTEYTEANRHTVEAALSIVNNIVRRKALRDSFDQFNLCDHIVELQKSPIMSRDMRIICVAIVYHIAPQKKINGFGPLADRIRADLVEIIDAASNSESFIAEGFTLNELIEILEVLCRDEGTKKEVGNNQTLSFSLVRSLAKNYHPEKVVSLARAMYTDSQFATFKRLYLDKHGASNKIVVNLIE